ncbi:hypothetical protein SLEP1_g51301 [Rubroshorea leprosula]|uniref:Uncharacterized protein n=1 Tax=Rubroshorea leprosula TaxID=152421 RepID=A0AAV5M2T3_9ROSI|nr:hypothetical protein SLEP1_g51301 [Rubroshorea leprosula]
MCSKPTKLALRFGAGFTEKTKCAESHKAGYRNDLKKCREHCIEYLYLPT